MARIVGAFLEPQDDGLVGPKPLNGLDRLQRLLNLLTEKDRCSMEELANAAGWPVQRTRSIVEFLAEHGMLSYHDSDSMVRLEPRPRGLMIEQD